MTQISDSTGLGRKIALSLLPAITATPVAATTLPAQPIGIGYDQVRYTESSKMDSASLFNVINHEAKSAESHRLVQQFHRESMFVSSVVELTQLESYQALRDIGNRAVRVLISDLRETPSMLVNLLGEITGENPVRPDSIGNVVSVTRDWINWYDREYNPIAA